MDMFPSFFNLSSFGTVPKILATVALLGLAAAVWYAYRTFFKKSASSEHAVSDSDGHQPGLSSGPGDESAAAPQEPGTQQASGPAYYPESSSYQQLPPNLPVPPGPVYSEQQPQMSGTPLDSA